MKFPYLPLGPSLKPLVPISLLGTRPLMTRALVDSGADISLFDLSIAEYLGVDFEPELGRQISGVGGVISAEFSWVNVTLAARRLRLKIFFAPNVPVNLLGRDNFFHYFRVAFDEAKGELDLRYRKPRA